MTTPSNAAPAHENQRPVDPRGLYLDEETAVVLTEGVASILNHIWRAEHRTYHTLPTDDRPGHVFEQMMRVKAIVNRLRHHLSAGLPLLGACPHCRGCDGDYVIDGVWWGFCQLCEVRWFIDELELAGTIWPVRRGRFAHELHDAFEPVRGVFEQQDAA